MRHETIGFALCGSFCTFSKAFAALETLLQHYDHVIPIVSEVSWKTDTRFGIAQTHLERLEALCGHAVLHTQTEVEPFGPQKTLDALVIAPCTGNTLAKLAHGIADSTVTLAAKAHLRNAKPIVLAISSNDALAAGAENLGRLLNRKHYYFVPFRQDSPEGKPTSLVAELDLLTQALDAALNGKQLQPMLLAPAQERPTTAHP